MGAPQVIVQEIDASTRVPAFVGVYGGIVIPAKKGRTDRPSLVTSDSALLLNYTPDQTIKVGYDLSYYSALAFLEKSQTLWVQRAVNEALYSGLVLNATYDSKTLSTGLADPTAYVFDSEVDIEETYASVEFDGVTFTAVNAGVIGNSIELEFDGLDDIDTIVGAWNTANPSNTVSHDGTGSDVLVAGTATLVGGVDEVSANDEALLIYSANEGAWGNKIGVKVTNYATAPSTVKEPDSFMIEVFHVDNTATALETFICSRVEGAKDGYGLNIFVEDVLEASGYIRAISNPLVDPSINPKDQSTILYMGAGDDGLAVTDTEMISALQNFSNPDDIYVTLLLDGGYTTQAYHIALNSLAVSRGDCVAILSTPYSAENASDYITSIVDYRKDTININSSYAAIYTPHIQITDKFNDRKLWVSPDGYASGAISETGSNFELWYPAAGFRRGVLAVEDVKRRFSLGEMGLLYDNGINPIRFFSGRGIVIWGQKTLSSRPSALDRLNVRLLLVIIEPAIKRTLEDFLFELNDEGTRAVIKSLIESYMDTVQARRGVEAYQVVCDDSNNTDSDVDNNRLIVDLFVRPTRSIETISLRVVITSSSISFEEAAQAI